MQCELRHKADVISCQAGLLTRLPRCERTLSAYRRKSGNLAQTARDQRLTQTAR